MSNGDFQVNDVGQTALTRRGDKMKKIIVLGVAWVAVALLLAPRSNADGVFTATLIGANEVPPTGALPLDS